MEDTIVALATPLGNGGISIVRISGEKSFEIATSIFSAKDFDNQNVTPRKLYLGKIKDNSFKENCLAVYFKTPFSYTGEDVVEFQCHGGTFVCNKIIDKCLENGARLAMPGEFTKRSFINGKISLDGAEGVIDVINAQTESEARAGFDLVNGELYKTVKTIQKSLTNMLAEIEVSLDYPEHDIEYETAESINVRLIEIKDKLNKLLETSKQGKIIKEGVNVVILGKPNVGKSSLMNALLNYDRAIVTEVAGTTRDTLQESYVYKDMKVNITDTAGIHESEDIVEKIGIEKAKESINNADIILLVLDGSKELSKEDKENLELIKGKRAFVIINKSDLEQKIKLDFYTINISAKNKDGIESIKEKIYETVTKDCFVQSDIILTNKRHEMAVKDALNCIETAINNIFDISLDCVAVDIKMAWEKLGEITGETTGEDIIDAIFSKFCLGK